MDNLYRRSQILELVRLERVATQADLCRKLARRGIHVTQATVSRDIEELGLIKTREGYRLPNAPQTAAPMKLARGPMLQSHAPRNEPVVTVQSRIK